MRIHHDKDFAESSQSQEQKLDMESGMKVISQISASLFNVIPSICVKWLYEVGLHSLGIDHPSIFSRRDITEEYFLRTNESFQYLIQKYQRDN